MNKLVQLAVAALLLMGLSSGAAVAAEVAEHESKNSKNARKVAVTLAKMGINNPEVVYFAQRVERNVKGGRLQIMEEEVFDGTLKLEYKLRRKVGIKQLELRYAPEDSNMEYTASTRGVMMRYKFTF